MSSRGRSLTRTPKRARSVSRSRSRASSKSMGGRYQTTQVNRTWPYANGMSPTFDPFPAQMVAKMRYSETLTLTTQAGAAIHHLFRANGIYDPNVTGIGHQPYGHDTYQSIYNHYQVLNSTIVVTVFGGAYEAICGVSVVDDAVIQSNIDSVKETKGTRMVTIVPNQGCAPQVQNYYNVNQVFAKSYQKATDAPFGSTLSDQTNFDIWVCRADFAAVAVDIRIMVDIVYTVKMWELKDLGQS